MENNDKVTYHFFLYMLDDITKTLYKTVYSPYTQHYYMCHKYEKDNIFVIVRTSKRCYRVCHYRKQGNVFMYFSCRNYSVLGHKINGIVYKYALEDFRLKAPVPK